MGKIRVQRRDFNIDAEIKKVEAVSRRIGGVVVFIGAARDFSRGKKVTKLFYEHYPAAAQKKLEEIRRKALQKFDIIEASITHRIGEIKPGGNIVMIVVGAEHRADAFKACRWCIDEVKRTALIWKKEFTDNGELWVGRRAS